MPKNEMNAQVNNPEPSVNKMSTGEGTGAIDQYESIIIAFPLLPIITCLYLTIFRSDKCKFVFYNKRKELHLMEALEC